MNFTASVLMIIGVIALGVWLIYKLKTEFSERLFFKTGLILFLIQGVANSWGLYLDWDLLPLWAIISKLGGITFNFLIAYFFYYLMGKMPASMGGSGLSLTAEELNDFLKEDGS